MYLVPVKQNINKCFYDYINIIVEENQEVNKLKIKCYKNLHTKEVIYEDEKTIYAMKKLGINITAKGENGHLTEEQQEFIDTFTDWYFSDNWIEEWEDID